MFNITNSPIAIICNYRTGSSALCRSLAAVNKLVPLGEPALSDERKLEFFKHYNSNNYVVKFMPDQIANFRPYQTIIDSNCFKIKLTRSDKVSQITSYYIASMRGVWGTLSEKQNLAPYFLSIDSKKIDEAIDRILMVDGLLDNIDIQFDMVLTYEDLGIISNTQAVKTHQPKNLDRIKSVVKEKLGI
jgi:hypothetical protein